MGTVVRNDDSGGGVDDGALALSRSLLAHVTALIKGSGNDGAQE